MGRVQILPRLLTLTQAASYCGVTISVFERPCPVVAIDLSGDGRADPRLLRWDRAALNDWIDQIGGRAAGTPEGRDWLAEIA